MACVRLLRKCPLVVERLRDLANGRIVAKPSKCPAPRCAGNQLLDDALLVDKLPAGGADSASVLVGQSTPSP